MLSFHAEHITGTPRPRDLAEEELQCDKWARDWFMSGVSDYAKRSGHTHQGGLLEAGDGAVVSLRILAAS